jgi:hypothetical protein
MKNMKVNNYIVLKPMYSNKKKEKIMKLADKIADIYDWENENDRIEWYSLIGLLVPETDENSIS